MGMLIMVLILVNVFLAIVLDAFVKAKETLDESEYPAAIPQLANMFQDEVLDRLAELVECVRSVCCSAGRGRWKAQAAVDTKAVRWGNIHAVLVKPMYEQERTRVSLLRLSIECDTSVDAIIAALAYADISALKVFDEPGTMPKAMAVRMEGFRQAERVEKIFRPAPRWASMLMGEITELKAMIQSSQLGNDEGSNGATTSASFGSQPSADMQQRPIVRKVVTTPTRAVGDD